LRVNNPRMGQKPNSSAVSAVSVSEGVPEDSSEEESGDLEEPEEAPPEAGEEARQVITEPGSSDFPGDSAETLPSPQAAPGKWKSPEERNLFIRVVKTFLGVPYRLGGATLKGIDCSAFVRKIYEIFNVELPRTTWEQLRIGKRVLRDDLKIGDLVFFKGSTRRAGTRHVGIYIGNSEFVHASSRSKEVRVDSLEAPYFSSRFVNGIRVKELDKDL